MVWIVLAVIFGIAELLTAGFFILNFSFASIVAYIASLITDDLYVQLLVFLVSSIIFLFATKPIANKLQKEDKIKTNTDKLIGQVGVVTETVNNMNSTGQAKFNGEIWSIKSNSEENIEKDQKVKVIEVSGVKLIVEKI
ncbi:MAG: NfeD family protein [Clostridia bacterium]|jgi:membrane protein implicated in regulation of membrane protease activity|nr:NfeD family protein [Clostridia bacterium]